MIALINRRFVPFFFNRGGPGQGHDPAASAFVNRQTTNHAAYLAAFEPTGKIVGETALYADKDEVARFLVDLLAKYPEYAQATDIERQLLAANGIEGARLAEDTGDYADAERRFLALLASDDAALRAQARLGLLRLLRHARQWDRHQRHEAALRELAADDAALTIDADVEAGYRLIANGDHQQARTLLQPLTARAGGSRRLAEAHFIAGVACWFDGEADWAKLHWGWIVDNLPEDRLMMRARIAAAAEGMPYRNPELGGYRANTGNIGTFHIVTALQRAMQAYREMLPLYRAGTYRAARPGAQRKPQDGGLLVPLRPKNKGRNDNGAR